MVPKQEKSNEVRNFLNYIFTYLFERFLQKRCLGSKILCTCICHVFNIACFFIYLFASGLAKMLSSGSWVTCYVVEPFSPMETIKIQFLIMQMKYGTQATM